MNYPDIPQERIQILNPQNIVQKDYVLYWMQQSQRAEFNHALEYAVRQANAMNQALLVIFALMDNYPEANQRHYTFMLEGLQEVRATLKKRGIKLVVQIGFPPDVVLTAARKASLLICDRGYLQHQKQWRRQLAEQAPCRMVQVESDAIVPVEITSGKAEYAAYTLRPKIRKVLSKFMIPVDETPVHVSSLNIPIESRDLGKINALIRTLRIDSGVEPVSHIFHGGTSEAKARFQIFIDCHLKNYNVNRNQPHTDDVSHMSMYLHFGQISPLYLALEISGCRDELQDNKDAYLEELTIRRELAINFVNYTPDYETLDCLPAWARKTLNTHRNDLRPYVYTLNVLDQAQTHDPYWNAAMNEMKYTGYMHGYMRMYWGKKILEWSASPEEAYRNTLVLNNRYFIDGRDPNSYAGVGWIFGLHDRAWKERPVFGKVRYMTASGLERKCDMKAYLNKIQRIMARC